MMLVDAVSKKRTHLIGVECYRYCSLNVDGKRELKAGRE